MIKMNMNDETIISLTDMDKTELEKLKKELKAC